MAEQKKIDVAKLTEPEMVQLLVQKSKAIEQKFPDLAEKAASYRAYITSNTPEVRADNAKTLENLKLLRENSQQHFLGAGEKSVDKFSHRHASTSLDTPSILTRPHIAKLLEGDVLARKPYDPAKVAQMSDAEIVGRLHEQASSIKDKFPELEKPVEDFQVLLHMDKPEAKAGRAKLFNEIRTKPDLAEKFLAPDSHKKMTDGEPAKSFLGDSITKMGGLPTPASPSQNSGFLGGLFNGGFSDFFKKIGEMLTKFLNGLGIGGGSTGSATTTTKTAAPSTAPPASTQAPKPGGPKPSPQPGAQPKAEAGAAPEAKDEKPEKETTQDRTAASTVEEDLGDVEASKPHADDVGKDLGQGSVAPETAAKATELQERLGKTDPNKPLVLPPAIKDDQTGAQKTSSADISQEWAALQDKFGINEAHLNKLKPQEAATVAAVSEENLGPRAVQQGNTFKV